MFQPLAGKRVIETTQVLAGPYCTYQLALMGAEVIKIEKPGSGDWARQGGQDAELAAAGMPLSFLTQNAGKKSVALDLKTSEGLAILKQMVAEADIFVENFRPGTAAKLGIAYEDLARLNDGLIYASLSAYGQDGPIGHRPAYDHIIQGMVGIMHTTGTPQTVPLKVGSPYVDYATGLMGAFAVTAAMLEKERTGKGQRVDVAMLDTAMLLMASLAVSTMATGNSPPPTGAEAFSRSPSSGTYDTTDGHLGLAANNQEQFARLCLALDLGHLLDDERFSPANRKANTDALRAEFSAKFATRSAAEWEDILDNARVPAVRVRKMHEVLSEGQMEARGLMQTVPIASINRDVAIPTLGFKANGGVTAAQSAPPTLGEHTDEVLGAMGLDLAALRAGGVI